MICLGGDGELGEPGNEFFGHAMPWPSGASTRLSPSGGVPVTRLVHLWGIRVTKSAALPAGLTSDQLVGPLDARKACPASLPMHDRGSASSWGGPVAARDWVPDEACAQVWAGQARCADGVRGCPCDPAAGNPRVRTYGGQRRRGEPHAVVFTQVRGHIEVQVGAYCKTAGSAYVGSNPTPATNFRRSKPVTLDCVTGFCVQKGAVHQTVGCVRGLCVGWIPPSASVGPGTVEMPSELPKCAQSGYLDVALRRLPGRACVGYARDFGLVRVHIADRAWSGADGAYNRSVSRVVTNA